MRMFILSVCFVLIGCWPDVELVRLDRPERVPVPAENLECDVLAQDCPTGQKCVVWSKAPGAWNATRCVPLVSLPAQEGEPCTLELGENDERLGPDSCDVGLGCWNYDENKQQGTCIPMCQGTQEDKTCADKQSFCFSRDVHNLVYQCIQGCNPLAANPCTEGSVCIPTHDENLLEVFVCFPQKDTKTYGEKCEYLNECAAKHICASAWGVPTSGQTLFSMEGACTVLCDRRDDKNTCPDAQKGQICLPFYTMDQAPEGLETLGVCGINL